MNYRFYGFYPKLLYPISKSKSLRLEFYKFYNPSPIYFKLSIWLCNKFPYKSINNDYNLLNEFNNYGNDLKLSEFIPSLFHSRFNFIN